MATWLKYNTLTLNARKAKVISLGNHTEMSLYLEGPMFEIIQECLHLGVSTDSNLIKYSHIDRIHNKCIYNLNLVEKAQHTLDVSISRFACLSTVIPMFDYCAAVYMITPRPDLTKLQKLQNGPLNLICHRDIFTPV